MVGIGGSGQRILVEFDKGMDVKLEKQGHEKGVHTYTGLVGWLGKMLGLVKELKVGNETVWVGAESAKKFAFRHGLTPKTGDWKSVNVDDAVKNVAKNLEQARSEKVSITSINKSEVGALTEFKNLMDRIGVKLDDRKLVRFVMNHTERDVVDFGHNDFDELVRSADMSKFSQDAVNNIKNDELRATVDAVLKHIKHVQAKKPDAASGKPASPTAPTGKAPSPAKPTTLDKADLKEIFRGNISKESLEDDETFKAIMSAKKGTTVGIHDKDEFFVIVYHLVNHGQAKAGVPKGTWEKIEQSLDGDAKKNLAHAANNEAFKSFLIKECKLPEQMVNQIASTLKQKAG